MYSVLSRLEVYRADCYILYLPPGRTRIDEIMFFPPWDTPSPIDRSSYSLIRP